MNRNILNEIVTQNREVLELKKKSMLFIRTKKIKTM